ncbi:hypothetical protein EUX98_g265 [Antrodiella citrinella]|uniref:PPP4R2-domain-containing protein n=1 Tax=Antrodiella citrinella TaxID=2447956 RepID=A0A4V3XJP8_9APHY|nr:hypothetical protein EUX98_g265 [Antrodiella citrinella]
MTKPFEWKPEYNSVVEQIAATDQVHTEWELLRHIIKAKIDQNIALYLENPPPDETVMVQAASMGLPKPLPMGGLKLPPFAPRIRLEGNPNEAPKHNLSPDEAKAFREDIFKSLDNLEGPPFTIQRVCELCLSPKKHYRHIGKFLRAIDKALLVTSTWDAFPVVPAGSKPPGITNTSIMTALSAPPTPMFSPIPFLHGDARRSQSRSPPPSPLTLTAIGAGGSMTIHAGRMEGADQKVIGLVDELDDPSPGHLSDHPHPLSSTTTAMDTTKPVVYKSLDDRFTRGEEQAGSGGDTAEGAGETSGSRMAVDEEGSDDKENKAS